MNPKPRYVLVLVLALLGAGCTGAVDDTSAPSGDLVDAGSGPDAEESRAPAETGPVTVAHALGELTLDAPATRVVAIEWPYVEALLAAGVQPVGVADVAGYEKLVDTEVKLADSVVDVGTRQEPNLERIAELEPDLIIGVKFRHEKIHDTLSTIAPTLLFDPWPETGDQLGRMEETVRAIGQAVGRGAAAEAALADLHATMASGKATLADAGLAGEPFVLSQVLAPKWGDFRLFQDHHTAVQIIEGLGLENAWEDEFQQNGFSGVSLEAVSTVQEANFLYVLSATADLERFRGNPAWDDLQFVEEDRMFDLSGAWLLPGPLSGQEFVTRVVATMVPEAAAPRTIAHALGETVIEGTPTRVVALEWTYAENLIALGVQPIGVADVENYAKWVNVPLGENVVDVGTRQEPNLERIAELEPDLIIGVKFRHEQAYDTLSTIAPTLLFDPYPGEDAGLDQFTEMEQTFHAMAQALNREAAGRHVITDMHAHFDEAAAALAEANRTGAEILLAQAFTWQDAPTLRVFTDNALAVQIAERIGFENAWTGEYAAYGFDTVSLEALQPVQHADFFYVAQSDDDPFRNQWKDNAVWNDLQFVEEDRVYPLGGDTWLFGGPLSAELVVDQLLATYLG